MGSTSEREVGSSKPCERDDDSSSPSGYAKALEDM
jgi:hypothetical protein